MSYLVMMGLGPYCTPNRAWAQLEPSSVPQRTVGSYLEPSARPTGLCSEPSEVQRAERPKITQLTNLSTQLYLDRTLLLSENSKATSTEH